MNVREKTKFFLSILDKKAPKVLRAAPGRKPCTYKNRLPKEVHFSAFNSSHDEAAWDLTNLLCNAKDFDEYKKLISDIEENENEGLFLYVLYSSVRHRPDCEGVPLPPIEERDPHWFFSAETIHEAIQLSIHEPTSEHVVRNRRTATDLEPESRLAYFREDIGLNRHHWYWHVIYPTTWDEASTGIIKDRKGEIFYYMHQQMIARYNCERFSNNMRCVEPLNDFQEELPAYSSNMTSQRTGVHFAFRPAGLKLKDVSRDGSDITVRDLEKWRSRILDAIYQGHLHTEDGDRVFLQNEQGIDILGAVVESSSYAVNRQFYGNLHNMGHVMISNVQDPDGRFNQHPNVMGFNESASRDPVFYRWHKFIDDIFQRHKSTLKPYCKRELTCNGIRIISATVRGEKENVLKTFMREGRSDLSHAYFLKTEGKILVKYEYLDHEPFKFIYKIENTLNYGKEVTIRVFLGPKYDECGNALTLNQQRLLMIELDKVHHYLHPGENVIVREDIESSVTLKERIRSFRCLKKGNIKEDEEYCSCGWPQHLLIPRGKPGGMAFDLFVMCTNYVKDKADDCEKKKCCGAVSYCGSKNKKYPDKKPMGFPFDRRINGKTMRCFLTHSMKLTDVTIQFDENLQPPANWVLDMYDNI